MILTIDNRWLSTQPDGMDLDTALLRAFLATVEHQHFGRAAEELFITQQALSKRIQRLEDVLGTRLFERTSRSVEPTGAGKRLLPYAREVVDGVDAAVAAAVGLGDAPLRVDVLYEHLAAVELVRRAVARDPELRIEVTARSNGTTAVDGLRRGDFDLAFGRAVADPWPPDIRRRPVLLEPMGLLTSADHPLAGRSEVTLPELAEASLWFPMVGAPVDWLDFAEALRRSYGITLDPGGPSLGFEHFLDRTAEGPQRATFIGLGMRPPADPRLRVVPIVAPTPVFVWAVMWRRRTPEAVVNRLLSHAGSDGGVAYDPDRVWVPDTDRAWLAG